MSELQKKFLEIQKIISELPVDGLNYDSDLKTSRDNQGKKAMETALENLTPEEQCRIRAEFEGWGPLDSIINDQMITEILVNSPTAIWYEKNGQLHQHNDFFLSQLSFNNFIRRLCLRCSKDLTLEQPFIESKIDQFRITLISQCITGTHVSLSLRRHPENPWTFEKLRSINWCTDAELTLLKNLISEKVNFLIVGSTGVGKTSVINSCLQSINSSERCLLIEDTDEIKLPNSACIKLLTRLDQQNLLPEIDQAQLVKKALRLRPDRIIMGEIRGPEAKDFLMAIATGHRGSFGTLHAQDAGQALLRLEMLIQIGAPQWDLQAIRRLIQMSLSYIIVIDRDDCGKRKLKGLYKINSLEEFGFLLERVENTVYEKMTNFPQSFRE